MSRIFTLPDLGEGLTEAEIVEWLVDDGAPVEVDQAVVVVETAKASVEIPCPYAGRVTTRHGAPGQVLAVGSPLVTVAEPGASPPPNPDGTQSGSGQVLIGYGTTSQQPRRRRAPRGHATGREESARRQAAGIRDAADKPASSAPERERPRVISPLVRKLADQHGIDLATVIPSYGTVIRRKDLEDHLTGSPAELPRADSFATSSFAGEEASCERIPLTGIRKAISDKLTRSRHEIPDATTWVDVDATDLLATRDAIKRGGIDQVGLLALVARICVAGLRAHPELNASVEDEHIVRHRRVHLACAMQTPRGLMVPVVHDADRMTTRELGASLAELTRRAREETLTPADLTGGTFTVNNYGVFGVDGSTPILNYPQAAMLGIGRLFERPWVVEGQLAVRTVTQLSFTFDHRVCDGASAGAFLRFVADAMESPGQLIAQL